MSDYTTAYTTQTMSTTGTRERDVSDTIRHLFPDAAWMPIVSSGKIETPDDIKKEKGMFGKRMVTSPKFEAFTYSPPTIEFEAVSLDTKNLTLVSTTGLVANACLVNSADGTTAFVDSVTSTTVVVITSYGETSFSPSAGDTLIHISKHYEENSTDPSIYMKDPDNLFNYTFIFRQAVAISDTANQAKHYGGNRYKHINKENGADALRKLSNNLVFDNKPASGENTTMAGTKSVASCDGIRQWAQTEYDFGGAMTMEAFMQDMPLTMHESVKMKDPKLVMCGYEFWAVVLGWLNDNSIRVEPGSYEKWGVESMKILTVRGYFEIMIMDMFNRGSYTNQALVVNPERYDYVYMKDRDVQLRKGIGANDLDGQKDEIYGECSICPDDNGYSTHHLKNCF